MTHDELAEDLAAHLRGAGDVMTWCDMQMGPSGSQRPDVYAIPKTYSAFRPISYEVKVSTADFRGDVTAGKWMGYLKYSAGVVFACEHGLLTKDMIPKAAGLIIRGPSGQWRSAKRPTLTPCETLPRDAWMKLLIDGIDRTHRGFRQRAFNDYKSQQKIRTKLGDDVAKVIEEMRHSESMIGYYQQQTEEARAKSRDEETKQRDRLKMALDRYRREYAPEIVQIEAAVGCKVDSYMFRSNLKELLGSLSTDARVAAASAHLKEAQRAVEKAAAGLSRIPLDKIENLLTTLSSESPMELP